LVHKEGILKAGVQRPFYGDCQESSAKKLQDSKLSNPTGRTPKRQELACIWYWIPEKVLSIPPGQLNFELVHNS